MHGTQNPFGLLFQFCLEAAHATMPCHVAMLLLFQSTFRVNIMKTVSAKRAILTMQRQTCYTCLPCGLICGRPMWPACKQIQHLFYSQTHVASRCLPTLNSKDCLSLRLDTSSLTCRPSRHPDLATLRGGSHWDAVIVVSIPLAASPAAAPAGPLGAEAAAVYTNGHHVDGSGTSPVHSESSSDASPPPGPASGSGHHPFQAGAVQHAAESVLILGLRGHRHDLERYLSGKAATV